MTFCSWLPMQATGMAEVAEVRNRRVLFKDFIKGWPTQDDFIVEESTRKLEVEPGSKDVLIKTLYLSIDPYMRGRMNPEVDYFPPFTPGDVVTGITLGKVVKSDHPNFKEGDYVTGLTAWEEYHLDKQGHAPALQKIPFDDIPLSYHLGLVGASGISAWAAFYKVSEPKAGERVYVSAAAGAVGQLVGQFAKLSGCYVVGSAGSDEKVKLLTDKLGFDAAFNYKTEDDLQIALRRYFPDGIDIYFDNVGGRTLDAVLKLMNINGRITVCGMISQYNLDDKPEPIYNLGMLVPKRIKMQGFLVPDYYHLFAEFAEFVYQHHKQKKIVYVEDVVEGLENAPSALIGLLAGHNIGKRVVKVAND